MKNYLLFIIFCCSTTFSFANIDSIPTAYLGIKGGVNFTQMLSSPSIPQRFLMGNSAGLGWKHINVKGLGIQVELNYAEAGWDEVLSNSQQYRRKLNYLELPFFTHLLMGKQSFRPFIQLGSYLAFLLNERESIAVDTTEVRFYYGQKISNFSFGIGGGAGFSLKTGIGTFQIEGRYLNGLRNNFNLLKLRDDTGQTFTTALNMQVGAYVSYWISL